MKILLQRMWRVITAKRKRQLYLLLMLMIVASLLEVVSISMVLPFLALLTEPQMVFNHEYAGPFIQFLGISSAEQLLLPVTVVFILSVLVTGCARILLLWGQTKLSHGIGADLSYVSYNKTLSQDYEVHLKTNSGDVIAGISSKVNQIVDFVLLPVLTIIGSLLMLVMIISVLFIVDPVISTLAFVGFGGLYVAIIFFSKNRLLSNSRIVSIKTNEVVRVLQEGLGSIRDILIDRLQLVFSQDFKSSDLALRKAKIENQLLGQSPRFIVESFGMVFIALLAYGMSVNDAYVGSIIPVLGVLAVGAQRMLPMLQQTYGSWSLIRGAHVVVSDALILIEQEVPEHYNNYQKSQSIIFSKSIVLKDVSFRYGNDGSYVLKDINLEIKKGDCVGIVGATGSGKSTLLDIIMGLLHPTEGQILVDGVEVNHSNHRSWQKNIAHIPQSIYLCDTTVMNNIAFGVKDNAIDVGRVKKSATWAQLSGIIESWSKKYDTVVGEQGGRISGGQKQRIGIARALYKGCALMIFDEATSALDNETERKIMHEIRKISVDKTLIMVAHRLTTLKDCNIVYEIEDGGIKRSVSYKELVGT